jgi:hypothetical protein
MLQVLLLIAIVRSSSEVTIEKYENYLLSTSKNIVDPFKAILSKMHRQLVHTRAASSSLSATSLKLIQANLQPHNDTIGSFNEIIPSPRTSSIINNDTATNTTEISNNTNQIQNFLTYINSTYGIGILYPSTWNVSSFNNTNGSRTTTVNEFDPPIVSNVNARILTLIDTFNHNETLPEYVADTIQSYRREFANFTLVKADTDNASLSKVMALPGYDLFFTYDNNGTMTLLEENAVLIGNEAYYVFNTVRPSPNSLSTKKLRMKWLLH